MDGLASGIADMADNGGVERFRVLFLAPASAAQHDALRRIEGDLVAIHSAHDTDEWSAAARNDNAWWLIIGADAVVEPQTVRRFAAVIGQDDAAVAAFSDFYLCPDGPATQRTVQVGGWSVERARWQTYTGAVAFVHPNVMRGLAGAADVDTHLALVSAADQGSVAHCPVPLYTVTDDRVENVSALQRSTMLTRAKVPFTLTSGHAPRRMESWPTVSVVIPTRGGHGEVRGQQVRLIDITMRSVIDTTEALEPQFVLVVDTDVDTSYVQRWRDELGPRLVVVETPPPFNFSDKINQGVQVATGEVVVMLNDDMQAVNEAWLDNLVAAAMEPDVGAVGALLLLADGTIQHAGHAFAHDGPQLLDVGRPLGPGPRRRNDCDRDVTGVSAACLVQRREVWQRVGGLDPLLPVNFNDVDYCARILRAGYRVVQCNSSVLYHYESQTKGQGAADWEIERLRWRLMPEGLLDYDALTAIDPPEQITGLPLLRRRVAKMRRVLRADGPGGVLRQLLAKGTQPPR